MPDTTDNSKKKISGSLTRPGTSVPTPAAAGTPTTAPAGTPTAAGAGTPTSAPASTPAALAPPSAPVETPSVFDIADAKVAQIGGLPAEMKGKIRSTLSSTLNDIIRSKFDDKGNYKWGTKTDADKKKQNSVEFNVLDESF